MGWVYITVTVPPTTTDNTPTITGTCELGGTVMISITVGVANTLNQTLAPFTCPNTGVYTTVVPDPIPDGPFCGQARIVDLVGNTANAVASCGSKVTPTGTVPGILGVPFPPVIIFNNPVPTCATATYQGFGSSVVITGSIVNGNFVPNPGNQPNTSQIIPLDSTLGSSTGVIKMPGCGIDINVITIFAPPPTASLTGLRGSPFPPIPVINNPVTNCATATFQLTGSTSIIQGSVVNGNFVPNPTSGIGGAAPIIPFDAQLGNSTGTLKQTSCGIDVNVTTRFGDPNASSSSSSQTTGGTITITPTSSSSATPITPKPTFKTPKDLKITINDPYLCNDDIFGTIDTEDNSKAMVTVKLSMGSNRNSMLEFSPEVDANGNYRIKLDHNNPNSRYLVPDGVYTVNYSVRLKGQNSYTNQNEEDQYIEGKPYEVYIINPDKCNPITVPFTAIELPRTGGAIAGQFGIIIMLIIGLVWVGEERKGYFDKKIKPWSSRNPKNRYRGRP